MNFLTNFGSYQGVIAAIVFLLGLLLVRKLPKYRWTAGAVLLALITPLATLGFWYSTGELGISDWDYYFSLHHTHRQTLLTHGELPHWNPYICGGTAGLADPEFRFFTPTFLLQLAFGIPTGFRLSIWLATATGAIGMLLLGKRLNLSLEASLLAAIAAAFSSVNLLEIVEGHPNIFAAMYIPWIFWAWACAYNVTDNPFARKDGPRPLQRAAEALLSRRAAPPDGEDHAGIASDRLFLANGLSASAWYVITALFLALTFFQGGIYLLMYTSIAFLVLPLLVSRRLNAFKVSVYAGLWALGFAAIKLIPVLLWLAQFQDNAYASSALTLPYLHEIFLGRYLHGAGDILPNQGSGWHEYGAYLGPFVLVLAFVGAVAGRQKRIVRMLTIAAALATLLSSAGPILKPIFDQTPFLPRSNISRVILFAVIPLSFLAGFGLDSLKKFISTRLVAPFSLFILFIVALDLFTLAYLLSHQAFVLPRLYPPPPPAPAPIAYSAFEHKTRHNGVDYTRAYENTLQGYGSLSYCSVLGPKPAVRTIHDEEDKDIISIMNLSDAGSFSLIAWKPSEVQVRVSVREASDIILNTNYASGWRVNGQPTKDIAGRVGLLVQPGEYDLTFEYKTPGFATGLALSAVSVLVAAILLGAVGKRYHRDV